MNSSIPAPSSAEITAKGGRGEHQSMGSCESGALIRQHQSAEIETWGGGNCGLVLRDEGIGTASPGTAATVPALAKYHNDERNAGGHGGCTVSRRASCEVPPLSGAALPPDATEATEIRQHSQPSSELNAGGAGPHARVKTSLQRTSGPEPPVTAAAYVTGPELDCACGGAWDCPLCAAAAELDDNAPAGETTWRMGVLVTPF